MMEPVVTLTKGYVKMQLSLALVCTLLSLLARLDFLIIGWLFFGTLLFSTGGWFFRDLGRASGGISIVIQILAWPLPIAISPLVAGMTFFSFWIGFLLERGLSNKETSKVTRIAHDLVKRFFMLVAVVGVGLVLITFQSLISDWQFWFYGFVFAFSGWIFPEVEHAFSGRQDESLRTYASIAVYLSVGLSAIFVSIRTGPLPETRLFTWLLFLYLFSLLRGFFLIIPGFHGVSSTETLASG